MRKNIIMTGNPYVSIVDMEEMGEDTAWKMYRAKIKSLDSHQMKLILKIVDLIIKIEKSNIRD